MKTTGAPVERHPGQADRSCPVAKSRHISAWPTNGKNARAAKRSRRSAIALEFRHDNSMRRSNTLASTPDRVDCRQETPVKAVRLFFRDSSILGIRHRLNGK